MRGYVNGSIIEAPDLTPPAAQGAAPTVDERLEAMDGCGDVGRMVDKLTREKMISLRQPMEAWKRHYTERLERVK